MAKITKAQLKKIQKTLRTDAQIGARYGITRQAVHQLRKRYGIDSLMVKNPERNKKIVKAYNAGTSGRALAEKYNLSIPHTYRIINEMQGRKKRAKKAAAKKVTRKKVVKKKK